MPVAVRLVEFSVALMLFLLVVSAGFLLYCAQHIIAAFMMISQPLFHLIVLTLSILQNGFIWFAEILLVVVSYLSGYGAEMREIVY
uniref:Uncharacterized protein n=1 Tax=Anopheles atroparvus TaxID=41427 RepID=A0AAG5DCP1_ANOAO